MKLFVPGEPGKVRTIGGARRRIENETAAGAPLVTASGVAVRFRFLHRLEVPPEGLAVRPELPDEPTLLELLTVWATALEGVLWADGRQIAVFHVRREWANVAGVEVSL